MPKSLSEHPAKILRGFLLTHWNADNTSDYDPNKDPDDNQNGLSMNRGWFDSNGYPLHVALTNQDSGVIGGGETNQTAVKGDGSGPVQLRNDSLLVTVFADMTADDGETAQYNGELAEDIAFQISSEIERILQENAEDGGSTEFDRVGTPGFSETPQPDDETVVRQATVGYGWVRE